MSKITSFFRKYAEHDVPKFVEAASILIAGVGLSPDERDRAKAGLQSLNDASDRILAGLKDLEVVAQVDANKLKQVVKSIAPEIVGDLVKKAVAEALEAEKKKAAT